ncbi:MAG: histidine kinase [Bacteroidales bacterium]|nr:histidine kinase [Bacteroidales bacterium]
MKNPFLISLTNTLIYLAVWILIAGVHAVILWVVTGMEPGPAVIDSLVYNILFAGIGLSLWYSIRYYNMERDTIASRLLNHALIALVVLGVWLGVGHLVLRSILASNSGYLEFLDSSMPWRAITGVFLYSIVVMVYYLYINSEDRQERIRKESALQLQVREAEIESLKSQINPHFLFNSLNSASSLISREPAQAREMIVRLSSFLRYSLETRSSGITTLEKELENIRYYLEIEKVRFGDRLHFDLTVPTACQGKTLPHMILQPLVENAIKHGVYESTEPVRINLATALSTNGELVVELTNDFDPEAAPRKGKGIGLINTRNRLMLEYDCADCLEIDKKATTYTVRLRIPQTVRNERAV